MEPKSGVMICIKADIPKELNNIDDEIEVNIQEFDGKQIVNVKILDRVLH